ncbi:MAG: DNA repair protein RadC [Puniceicoccales bacterium]|jgi:DNA repair protein RadC|nr:DNA repair protein RadC [Puniceicoccales bacterium]
MERTPQPGEYREEAALPPTPPLRRTPQRERPQERLERLGPRALQDAELLAMVLRSGTPGANVLAIASHLIHEAGSLRALVDWDAEDYRARKGIGKVKALQLLAIMEIARRIREQGKAPAPVLAQPGQVYEFFQDIIAGLSIEKSWLLCLNTRNALNRCLELTSGTARSTLMDPAETLRHALRHGAAAMILVHNHPGGDPEPSKADLSTTRRLADACKTVGIPLLDHVILGHPGADRLGQGWFSFKAAGLL